MTVRMAHKVALTFFVVALLTAVPMLSSYSEGDIGSWDKGKTAFEYQQTSDTIDTTFMEPLIEISNMSTILGKPISPEYLMTLFGYAKSTETHDMDIIVGQSSAVMDSSTNSQARMHLTGDISHTLPGSALSNVNKSVYVDSLVLLDLINLYFPTLNESKTLIMESSVDILMMVNTEYNYTKTLDKYVITDYTTQVKFSYVNAFTLSVDDKRVIVNENILTVIDCTVKYTYDEQLSLTTKAPLKCTRDTVYSVERFDGEVFGYIEGVEFPMIVNTDTFISNVESKSETRETAANTVTSMDPFTNLTLFNDFVSLNDAEEYYKSLDGCKTSRVYDTIKDEIDDDSEFFKQTVKTPDPLITDEVLKTSLVIALIVILVGVCIAFALYVGSKNRNKY